MNAVDSVARKRHIQGEESDKMLNLLDQLYSDRENPSKKIIIRTYVKDMQKKVN